MEEKYQGGSRFFVGFSVGLIIILFCMTFTSDAGFYSVGTLIKYSCLGGLFTGLINFLVYDLGYSSPEDLANEKAKSAGSHDSPSYDNYIGSSGDGGGSGGGE